MKNFEKCKYSLLIHEHIALALVLLIDRYSYLSSYGWSVQQQQQTNNREKNASVGGRLIEGNIFMSQTPIREMPSISGSETCRIAVLSAAVLLISVQQV
jgi:hypothetical protein